MDFKCVSVINQMLFNESKTTRRDRGKESLISQESNSDYNYMWGFFCVPDLLINLFHLFLFLTQRIRGGFPLIKKRQKKQNKRPQKTTTTKKLFFLDSKNYNTNKNIGLSVHFCNILIYFFTGNNPVSKFSERFQLLNVSRENILSTFTPILPTKSWSSKLHVSRAQQSVLVTWRARYLLNSFHCENIFLLLICTQYTVHASCFVMVRFFVNSFMV